MCVCVGGGGGGGIQPLFTMIVVLKVGQVTSEHFLDTIFTWLMFNQLTRIPDCDLIGRRLHAAPVLLKISLLRESE